MNDEKLKEEIVDLIRKSNFIPKNIENKPQTWLFNLIAEFCVTNRKILLDLLK
jgi:hypothetical protein